MPATLSDLEILALDCQATGANPARGHILEMGWTRTRASLKNIVNDVDVQVYPIRLPADAVIPRAVQRITGISEKTLESAVSSKTVWNHLLATAGNTVCGFPAAVCPAVIHFARFEGPFLRELHRQNGPPGRFPFQIICTHEIAVRLLPDLPRRGIRAIAGYYGHCMPELKRSSDHVVATAFIWQKMVQLLKTICGITELTQLIDWLADTKPAGRSKRVYPMNPQIRQQLPDKPGIYRMLRAGGDLLYIGKAKSLKQRVNSYFRAKAPHAEHTLEMLTQARELEVTQTGSALEAAILESDEIKRHSPPYNIALRRRQRQLVYCSRDLGRHAALAQQDFPVGPIPAGKTIEALAAFSLWFRQGMELNHEPENSIGYSLLALPPEYAPPIECLREGFEIFREHHRSRLNTQTPLRFLTGLGAKLWQERLDAAALEEVDAAKQNNNDDLDEAEDEPADTHTWTPEAVAAAIEAMIRHSAHLIRRTRWFCLLSESMLTWSLAGQARQKKNRVVFGKGAVSEQGQVNQGVKSMPPPGYINSFRMRQNNIDLITYDRMRVVTTELRRLLSEGRDMELCLRPRVTLGPQELIRALRWV
jgi:DNA polymerase-3 subunit epsilon